MPTRSKVANTARKRSLMTHNDGGHRFNPLVSQVALRSGTVDKQGIVPSPTYGCDGVAVSTVGCGPAGPGSSPGHGPTSFYTVEAV